MILIKSEILRYVIWFSVYLQWIEQFYTPCLLKSTGKNQLRLELTFIIYRTHVCNRVTVGFLLFLYDAFHSSFAGCFTGVCRLLLSTVCVCVRM